MPEPITPSSVEEVLRELEGLLPKYWDARYLQGKGHAPFLTLALEGGPYYLWLNDDVADAQAKEVLLAHLETLNVDQYVFQKQGRAYKFILWIGLDTIATVGKTRSEAVARAVLAVLSQQEREE